MIENAKRYIEDRTPLRPAVAVVLGSGLGAFAEELTGRVEIRYSEIPGWPVSTAVGHAGKLVIGKLDGQDTVVMAGRAHLYEGNTPAQVTHGVRVLNALGVRTIVFTNAAGGINTTFERGGLVLISDHINLQGSNPLVGGPHFIDMTDAYPRDLRLLAKDVAETLCVPMQEGVYAAMMGPSYETPAEIRAFRTLGADLVGMSTVHEVIVARHMGIEVLGLSVVTNMAAGVLDQPIDHQEVMEIGRRIAGQFTGLLMALIPQFELSGEA